MTATTSTLDLRELVDELDDAQREELRRIADELAPPTEPDAPNVVAAIRRVIRDLPGIGKDDVSPQGYAFRGIESITREAQPLFARHGVIFTPYRILDRETVNITVSNKPWTDEKFTVQWRVYGPGGRDDYIEIETPAIGRDNSDKGSNKAMTQAFKYALLPTLAISDARDDADTQRAAEADAPPAPVRGDDVCSSDDVKAIRRRLRELKDRGAEMDSIVVVEDQALTVLGVELTKRDEDGDLVRAATVDQADAMADALDARIDALPPAGNAQVPETSPVEDGAHSDAVEREETLDQSACPACGSDVSALNVLHSPEGPCDHCAKYGADADGGSAAASE